LETRRTLRQWREAIQNNEVAIPSSMPVFACQYRPDIQWRAAELYLVRGWTCQQIAKRYDVTRARIWQFVRSWLDRALTLGYLQTIPSADLTFQSTQQAARMQPPIPFFPHAPSTPMPVHGATQNN
jgi:hypothetical protein